MESVALIFGPAPKGRRRKLLRRMGWALLFAVVAAPIFVWRAPLIYRLKLMYWQRQCLSYLAPADQIVCYRGDATRAEALVNTGRGYRIHKIHNNFMQEGYTVDRTIEAWDQLSKLKAGPTWGGGIGLFGGGSAAPAPSRSERLIDAMPTVAGPAILFLHERRTASGDRRLVEVDLTEFSSKGDFWIIAGRSAKIGGLGGGDLATASAGLSIQQGYWERADGTNWRSIKAACFFAGQPDASNESRFYIDYELNGEGGAIDGEISDDGAVRLRVRNGPATRPGMTTTVTFHSNPWL